MDEAHHHRSLADRGGATLDRPRANIPHREDAGRARLEDALGTGPLASEDEAVVVERDRATEPVGIRCGSEEKEEGGERDPLTVAERRRLELAVGAVQRGDLAVTSDEDAGALEVSNVANICRRSWNRMLGSPACRRAGLNSRTARLCPSRGAPFAFGKMRSPSSL